MSKILTVSVAAYNVEQFLENTLTTLADPRYVDKLEVFVVDDGGKDGSLDIARRFEERFPDTFHAVHKENGGYGSTVNYSIAHATGKYFKLLDGDDWMSTNGLAYLIKRLEQCEDDVIITDFFIGPSESDLKVMNTRRADNTTIDVRAYDTDFPHGHWALCYKTEVLKRSGVVLPEHMLYTDQYYSTVPFAYASGIRFINTPVYCYRYGREEQSTSRNSRIKHAEEMLSICGDLMQFYKEHAESNNKYLFSRVVRYYIVAVRTLLLFPVNTENLNRIKEYETRTKTEYPEIFNAAANGSAMGKFISLLRKTDYNIYWIVKYFPDSLINR